MKKRLWMLILAAAMALVCLSAAGEEEEDPGKIVKLICGINVTRDETSNVTWPDFMSYISGRGLDDDDFDITYNFINQQSGLTVNADGTVTATADAESSVLTVTYTPKVEGRGTKTTFTDITMWVYDPITEITFDSSEIVLYMDEEDTVKVTVDSDISRRLSHTIDESIATAVYNYNYTGAAENSWYDITPVSVGSTELVMTAYNGVSNSIPVHILEYPSKVTFSQDVFYCNAGEIIDLGTDLGNGSLSKNQSILVSVNDNAISGPSYFVGDLAHFKASAGYYSIVMYKGDVRGSTSVYVYEDKVCTRIGANWATLKEREAIEIYAYDENGKKISRPMTVTKGSEFARLEGNRLYTDDYGPIEITVTNPDGSTITQAFEVLPNPTEIVLNATEVTLEIGETFQFEVGFDKGTTYYEIRPEHTYDEKYGINPTRMEDGLITAQNPGTSVYKVVANFGGMTATLTVTVPESSKAVAIDLPPEPFGIGHSYQMYVKDGNGKVVPAVFAAGENGYYAGSAELTAGGYITGVKAGTYTFSATLEDGRVLTNKITIKAVPKWISIDAVVMRKSGTYTIKATSDVGTITNLTYTIKNPKLITIENGVIKPRTTGKTTVTATSVINPEVSTTFTVKVISDTSSIYIGSTTISVPYGSVRYLPIVTDEDGEEVPMKWEITHNNPGTGNPDKSGFVLENGVIGCTWPDATCEVTGTVKGDNEYVVVTVKGYQLPTNVTIDPVQIWLEPGETQTVNLVSDDEYGGWGVTYWAAEVDGIVSLEEYVDGGSNTIKAISGGTTLVAAMLENGAVAACIVNVYDPEARLPGDVNEDGVVDEKDALIVMQYDAGWPVLINGWQGDVNADGSTNLEDAILIFQYDAGLDVELKQYIPEK